MSSTEAEMLGEMSGEMAICVPVSTLRYLSNDLQRHELQIGGP